MRVSDLLVEGYVQRNGAAFTVFGLRLHFYSNHVFYVVKGGPDLSIYRDGVPTPRNDEIYVKDAAARGVPKDIIQVISYWLNTPDIKQEALLPRIEQALEHIAGQWVKQHNAQKEDVDEALLSPRVHEIFLKGLVGAILSGGLSLGLDYAKEKTADLDKAGLQAIYKSIDPREYPELTKKLTPKDRQGLDAILGKIKEAAMFEGLKPLNVQQLATISDEALDKAYGYGRSKPGNTFGWQANLKSAEFAKRMIDKGVTDIEKISDAIHQGWNVTAQEFVKNPNQFDDTAQLQAAGKLEAKLQQREKLMKISYGQLPDDAKEKDRVVARALLGAITGQQVTEGNKDNKKKLKDLKLPRDKNKMSNFDPRTDLKVKETTMKMDVLLSEEEKRMSRAGKGVMKYGKDGMKALAKAGRDGASDEKLDKLRDKYDKYDEDINEGPRGMGVAARDWAQNKKSQASRRGDAGWSKDYRKPGEPSKADLSAMAA